MTLVNDPTIISKETREDMFFMSLGDRVQLVHRRAEERRQEYNMSVEDYAERFGSDLVVYQPRECRVVESLMGKVGKDMERELQQAMERLHLPEGWTLQYTSHPWSSRDDGGTDHQISLLPVKVPVNA